MKRVLILMVLAALLPVKQVSSQQRYGITVKADKPYSTIQPTMWGVFFEDINFGADGGLYAEMIKNRSFEFYRPLMGWREGRMDKGAGRILIINRGEENINNPRFGRITFNADSGAYTLTNEGFRGMGIQKGKQYNFSINIKVLEGSNISLKIQFLKGKDEILGESVISAISGDWKKYEGSIVSSDTEPKAQFRLLFSGNGVIDIDMVSLFPKDTWKQRKNGLRADLVEMLAALKPGFVRFPGGCIVEGFDLENRYQWKKTVGNIDDRKMIINRWNTEMRNRQAPDYFQTFGLGFYEYFLLSEDLGAEPLPIINCGMACQFNSGEVVPMDQLDTYIQDALDLIEFANGPVTSKWGKLRADMGHPQPFNMKYLGIGNEQWDEQYVERYIAFVKVLKEKHPEVMPITTSGPSPDGPRFDYLWKELRKLNVEMVDEHYYKDPAWFLKSATRYDSYDRKGPKIFAGEYACHGKEDKASESRNTWESALCEAAFMTGLERNADIVHMASYAPLFAHVEAWQWRPDLIWFDNLKAIATPNYYVQKVFAANRGTHVIPVLNNGNIIAGSDSIYASAALDKANKKVYIRLVNVSAGTKPLTLDIEAVKLTGKNATVEELYSDNLYSYNSVENPDVIAPKLSLAAINKNKLNLDLKPKSVSQVTLNIQ